jgi:hypothetical protein
MNTVGPQTLTVGTANSVVDPARTGNPSVAVQIQNSSPYQLSVLSNGDTYAIQPFYAQTIPVAGGVPIEITPLAQGGISTACSVTLVFLLGVAPGNGIQIDADQGGGGMWVETPPQGDGPLTAQAIAAALSTQGTVDNLGTFPINASFNVVARHSYTALLVVTATQVGHSAFYANVANTSQFPAVALFGAPLQNYTVAATAARGLVACANGPGDTLQVTIFGTALAVADTVTVLGLTASPALPVRPDGRAYPLGSFFVASQSAAGVTTTPISAPPAGVRIMLKTLQLICTGGGAAVSATINGGTGAILYGATGVSANMPIPDTGILLDPATALTVPGVGGVVTQCTVTYDLAG